MVALQSILNLCPDARRSALNRFLTALTCLVSVGVITSRPASAQPMQTLPGHVPMAATRLISNGRLSATNKLSITMGLPLRDLYGLTNLLADLYNPASSNFHRFLTPDEFAQRFGPTETDYQAVKDFAAAHNLTIKREHSNRTLLVVKGAVADVENAMNVHLLTYAHPKEKRTFFAPDTEPSLPAALPLLHVSGLNNYLKPHPMSLKRSAWPNTGLAKSYSGSGPESCYMGYDFRAAYVPGTSLTGTGQSVALVEFDGYYPSDITSYLNQAGLPSITLSNVLIDGFNGTPVDPDANSEVSLDIEMVACMAPAARIVVYEEENGGDPNDMLNQMAVDNQAAQISASWGFGIDGNTEQIFLQFAAEGISYFNASGDSGAYSASDGGPDSPSDDPNITSVGGTTLSTAGPRGAWTSETVWSWFPDQDSAGSGGISVTYSIPSWQQGISMTGNQGSTSMRNIPDVALTADNIYIVANDGQGMPGIGGTSAATPLWGALMALVNQQAATAGKPRIGFANPALYAIGKSGQYATSFHDITTGNNTNTDSPNNFYAVTGYDLCTGWGTPAGTNLINALAPVVNGPIISIVGVTVASESCLPTNGVVDPGETVTVNFALQNTGTSNTTSLVATLSPNSGIIAPSGAQTYGALAAGGSSVSHAFSFTAGGVCGSSINAIFNLQDGSVNLGTVSVPLYLGKPFSGTNFVQNFDASGYLPTGWSNSVSGSGVAWSGSAVNYDTYPYCFYSPELGTSGISDLISPPIPIGAPNAQLTFANGYDTYQYHGGCVLEIQLGTNAYADILAAGGSFVAYGYNSTIPITNTSSILAGRQAWSGSAGVFLKTVVNLPAAAAGQTIHLRWRLVSDNYYSYPGWYIDSVSMTENFYQCCGDSADLAISQTASTNSLLAGQNLTYNITVTNSGPQVATGVSLTNTLPAGVTFVSASSGGIYANGKVVWNINSLNASNTNKFSVTITPTMGGMITNVATVAAVTPDPNGANQTASIVTPVNMSPAITGQPGNQVALVGSNVSFQVAATGMPAPAFQWYFNGTNLSGATTTTLAVTNVQMAKQGNYYAIVTNMAGSVTSSVANLVVAAPPAISQQPSNKTALAGTPVNLQVTGSGAPSPAYQWRFNGTNVAGATNSSFTLASAQPAQAGSYSVVLTNLAGSLSSSNALVSVSVPMPTLSLGMAGSNFNVSLPSLSGVTYTLLYKNSFLATNWTAIQPPQSGTGGTITLTDPNPGPNGRFYRVLCSW